MRALGSVPVASKSSSRADDLDRATGSATPSAAEKRRRAVRALSDRGQHLEAFYACLYYAALRPSEAVMLRESDLYLPAKGWGRIVLAASASRAGTCGCRKPVPPGRMLR